MCVLSILSKNFTIYVWIMYEFERRLILKSHERESWKKIGKENFAKDNLYQFENFFLWKYEFFWEEN